MDFYINLAKIFMYFLYKYIYLEVINEMLNVPPVQMDALYHQHELLDQ